MKLRIKRKLDEVSAVGAPAVGGSIEGHVDVSKKRKKSNSENIEEMFSTATLQGGSVKVKISGEKEHAGHVERSKQQGLRNVMEDNEDTFEQKITDIE